MAALLSAVTRRDAEAAIALATEDIVFEPASTPMFERRPYHGHEGMRAYLEDLERDWDEFDITVAAVREAAHHTVVLARIYARAGGAIADGPAAFVFELREGRVAWAKTYRDREEALRFAGLE